ncbi:MAG: hypothetical protein EAZ20_07540 [Bacteroidetes bacterium]|nr:MAG: hypothetical protein EAZ20_07540 [Bacteroidota bacterium]
MKNIFAPKDFPTTELNLVIKNISNIDNIKKIIIAWQKDIESGKIFQLNETQLDMRFIHQFFGDILGYEYQNDKNWQIEIKPKTTQDSTRPDATLGFYGVYSQEKMNKSKAVIELKGANINLDKIQTKEKKGSPIEQAFGYVPKMGGHCQWVIVSNFTEIRLYHASDSSRYEKFEILDLLEDKNLEKFIFLFQKDRLFLENGESRIEQLLNERRIFEEKITNEFYYQYETIRQALFFDLKNENPNIADDILQNINQKLIDRIIFMCFVRDTLPMMNVLGKIQETYLQLDGLYDYKNRFWNDLKGVFRSFDKGFGEKIPHFNGGLFKKDELLDEKIKLYDFQLMPLVEFVLQYDFQSELNVNLLGHIFEQSLSNNGQEITTNIDIRKQDGIFYTPDFITKHIIKTTIETYLEEQKNQLLEKYHTENIEFWNEYQEILQNLKILDPSCGSGAFLTQVFEFLFDEWQIVLTEIEKIKNNGKRKIKIKEKGIFASKTTSENFKDEWKIKKMIVQNNLFGFDINNQSVQITKLALWLLTANRFVTLADLSNNILEINTLEAQQNSSFDIIIGNPPYVRQELLGEKQKISLQKNFPNIYNGVADLYVYFYAKTLELLKPNGYLGLITPNKWLKTKYGKGLRQLLKPLKIIQITDFFELRVFEDASTEPMIILLKNQKSEDYFDYFPISKQNIKEGIANFAENLPEKMIIQKNNLNDNEWIFTNFETQKILDKITGKTPIFYKNKLLKIISLNEYSKQNIYRGITTGLNKAFIIDEKTKNELIKQDAKSAELIKPYIQATDIKKWHLENENDFYLIFTRRGTEIEKYPAIKKYLMQFYTELKPKQNQKEEGRKAGKYEWFEIQDSIDYYKKFDEPKIIYIYTALKHQFFYDTKGYYLNNSSYFISNVDLFLSVFLNSKVFEWYKKLKFVAYGNADEGGRNKLDYNKMIDVPVPVLSAEEKKPFEEKAILLQEWSQKNEKINADFLKIMQADFKELRINHKLEKCFELSWQDFQDELKKQKIIIPLKQKTAYMNFFEEEKQKYKKINADILATEQVLDMMLMDLYGI